METIAPERTHLLPEIREAQEADTSLASGLFQKKGIVIIDDDEAFCELMEVVARGRGLPVTTFGALEEMTSFASLNDYDVAVIDYKLRAFNGLEIAEYVDVFFRDLPVMIVSGEDLENVGGRRWPVCIRRFLSKSFGPFAILQRSLDVLREHRSQREEDECVALPMH